MESKNGISGKTRLALRLEARAKIESLGVDSYAIKKIFQYFDGLHLAADRDFDKARNSLFDAIDSIQSRNLRNEVAEQLLGLNIKENDGRLHIDRSDFVSRFMRLLSPTCAKKLFDIRFDEISNDERLNYAVIKSLLETMDRKDAKAIFDDTRKRTAAEKNRIKFGGFYPGMSQKDVIVTSIAIGLDAPPRYSFDWGPVYGGRFLVFPRGLRYKLLEAEDLDFWEVFLNECVPPENGRFKYRFDEDSGKYLYTSIKYHAKVIYDSHSGELRLGTFGND